MSPSNGSDNERIGNKERTSPCHTSVLNLGNTPRLRGFESTDDDKDNEDATTLPNRDPRKFLPSQAQAMALLKRAVVPERRDNFVRRFKAAMEEGRKEDDIAICGTPIRWLTKHINALHLSGYGKQVTCSQILGSRLSFLMNSMLWMLFSIEPCHRLLLSTK